MSSAVGLHARESVELTPTAKDEIWSAPASAITCSDSSTTLDIPDGWTDIPSPDGGQLTLPLLTSAPTNVVFPTAQSNLHPKETPFHLNNQQSCGDESDTSPDGFSPGMRVWSERTITTKDKPNQVIRMTGVVVRTTSRRIVPDQTSDVPVDTPLVEVQWDGAKSTVLLSPSELHMETSSDQVTTDTSALASQDVIVPEVVEELTSEEAAERHRLELKVERAFYEAGAGLRVLREKRLYRSTHHTFEEYCRDRFGFSRQNVNYLIAASTVVENILTTNGCQNSQTSNYQILPTSERQVRPLTALEADEQRQIWQEAVEQSGGKVPSGRIVKGIVERLKEKHHYPATDSYNVGDIFTLTGLSGQERKYNDCGAITIAVNDFTLEVEVHDAVFTVKPDNLDSIDSPDVRRQLPSILKRVKRLRQCDLDRGAYYVLEGLGRQTYLTDFEADLLAFMEQRYGIE